MKMLFKIFCFLLCLGSACGVNAQIVTDTFFTGQTTPVGQPMSHARPLIKELVKYGPYELYQKGIVPGTTIYGVSYHKSSTGYMLTGTSASFEVKFRSGSMDSTVPPYSGAGITTNYYINTYMTGGFASWTTFYLGNNLTIPASVGWIPPLMVDVPFIYTGGSLEICSTWQTTLNSNSGIVGFTLENPFYNTGLQVLFTYLYDGLGNGGTIIYTRPATIIYHSPPPSSCSGMPNGGTVSGLNDVCKNQNFTLYLNNPSAGPGIVYQWQQSVVSPVAWSDIAGATNPTITTNTAVPMQYRCKVTCTNTNHTAISTTFTATPHFYHIDSLITSIVGNVLTVLRYDNDTVLEVHPNYYSSNWDTLLSTTTPFSRIYTTDGTYNLIFTCSNTCNADTAYRTVTIGCTGSPTFYDSISANHSTACSGNPVTLSIQDTLPSNYSVEWQALLNWNWVPLSGLSGSSASVAPTTNTLYRNKATCNISGNYKSSNVDTIYVTPLPTAGSIQANNTTGNYYTFTNNGMSNAQSYTWYFGDGDSSTSLSPSHHYNLAGTYTVHFVTYNAGNGCTDTATTTVNITTGIEEIQGKLFSVSPNPFKESFTITCPSAKGTITVMDAVGKVVKMVSCKEKETLIDTKSIPSGIYLIKYQNDHQTETIKIVKQQ